METKPDIDRIDRLIDWAEASHIAGDGRWSQSQYFGQHLDDDCGTSYCIAGKVLVEDGICDQFGHYPIGAKCASPGVLACEILGLENHFKLDGRAESPHPLFDGSNTIDDLRLIAKDIRSGALS